MPRVLIAGCGYIGQATLNLFQAAGWETEGWTVTSHSAEKLGGKPDGVRAVDISKRDEVFACRGEFDCIIQCASSRGGGAEDYRRVYLQGAHNLLEVFPNALLLFTSSTSVYAQRDGSWVTENSPAEPTRETGKILRAAEEVVLQHGGIIARLGGIYGPGRSALLQRFLNDNVVIQEEEPRFINQTHRDDVATALFTLIDRRMELPSRTAKIFNVVDDQPVLQSECYEWLASRLNRAVSTGPRARESRKRSDSNKRVSNAKLHSLGWTPKYPTFAEAMAHSILPSFRQFLPEDR